MTWSPFPRTQQDAAALHRQQLAADLAEVLATAAGRRYVSALIDRCGVFRSVYAPGSIEYLEGRRTVGLEILQDIEGLGREQVIGVLTEAMNADTERDTDA